MPAETTEHAVTDDQSVPHPGTIKINVQGAFIVDDDSVSPVIEAEDDIGYTHDTKDIRLPNHTVAVSHIAVDVRRALSRPLYLRAPLSAP